MEQKKNTTKIEKQGISAEIREAENGDLLIDFDFDTHGGNIAHSLSMITIDSFFNEFPGWKLTFEKPEKSLRNKEDEKTNFQDDSKRVCRIGVSVYNEKNVKQLEFVLDSETPSLDFAAAFAVDFLRSLFKKIEEIPVKEDKESSFMENNSGGE